MGPGQREKASGNGKAVARWATKNRSPEGSRGKTVKNRVTDRLVFPPGGGGWGGWGLGGGWWGGGCGWLGGGGGGGGVGGGGVVGGVGGLVWGVLGGCGGWCLFLRVLFLGLVGFGVGCFFFLFVGGVVGG